MSIDPREAFIPLPGDASERAVPENGLFEHPRFISVRAYADGTHPRVSIGQVWEDINSGNGDEHGARQVLVINVGTDSILTVLTVNFDGHGMQSDLGRVFRLPAHGMRPDLSGNGWRLRGISVPVDGTGRPVPGYSLPTPARPADFASLPKDSPYAPYRTEREPVVKPAAASTPKGATSVQSTGEPEKAAQPKEKSPQPKVETREIPKPGAHLGKADSPLFDYLVADPHAALESAAARSK